jgi:hypothetical protein
MLHRVLFCRNRSEQHFRVHARLGEHLSGVPARAGKGPSRVKTAPPVGPSEPSQPFAEASAGYIQVKGSITRHA